jgi:hypothetical protein
MTSFRLVPAALVLGTASLLAACNTAPTMPMGTAPAMGMHSPGPMEKADAQMKTMREMHEKMMGARTAEERSAMMAGHMKAMQDGMAMMKAMPAMPGMQGDMAARQQMMEKQMGMMRSMMEMMMDRMPATPAR